MSIPLTRNLPAEGSTRCDVPVASSSLMQAPFIERPLPPGRRVGIITVSGESLTAEHLVAASVAADTPVLGTEGGEELTRVLLNDEMRLDVEAAERDVLRAGKALVGANPEVGAIVLECTNMAPYGAALREHLSLPVYDMYSFPACPAHAHNLLFATVIPSLKASEGPTAGGLSRVAQLRGSDPMHHSGAHPKSDRLPTGITDRFAPESVIALLRNTQLRRERTWTTSCAAESSRSLPSTSTTTGAR